MDTKRQPIIIIIIISVAVVLYFLTHMNTFNLPSGESVKINDGSSSTPDGEGPLDESDSEFEKNAVSSRDVFETDGVRHTIPLDEIKRGCPVLDCIPSVDEPVFMTVSEADDRFESAGVDGDEMVGIALSYDGEHRFYPFIMLVTREIVNDTIGERDIVVTYCPLCGTGIVFDRTVDGEVLEFGVSGMLWQSNLLMYDRTDKEDDQTLWSQVLGEAVLGSGAGTKLRIIPSDISLYSEWSSSHSSGAVLNTGSLRDPYNGDYYSVAKRFGPNFVEEESPLAPDAYVYGIELDGQFKAYSWDSIPQGTTEDSFARQSLRIENNDGMVRIYAAGTKNPLPIVSGFWFSWVAAHPDTELYK